MKKIVALALTCAALAASSAGCSYAGIATVGDRVVITRNDNILFGLLRKVYVCRVTEAGITACQEQEKP